MSKVYNAGSGSQAEELTCTLSAGRGCQIFSQQKTPRAQLSEVHRSFADAAVTLGSITVAVT